jgi:hypothetical protein
MRKSNILKAEAEWLAVLLHTRVLMSARRPNIIIDFTWFSSVTWLVLHYRLNVGRIRFISRAWSSLYCNKFAGFYFTMEVYYTKSSIHNC